MRADWIKPFTVMRRNQADAVTDMLPLEVYIQACPSRLAE